MDSYFTVIPRNQFNVSTKCMVKQRMFPFPIVSMLLMHVSRLISMLVSEDACPPPPINALEEDVCLSPASLQCSSGCIASSLPPAFKSLDACLMPTFHSDYKTHLNACSKSHFLLMRFYFIHFDFLIIATIRRNYLLVSHVLFMSQHCNPIFLACSIYQKSMNCSHNSVK